MKKAVSFVLVSFVVANAVRIIFSCEYMNKYAVSNQRVSFHDAYVRCRQHGFDPVEILSEHDEKDVEALLKNETSYGWPNAFWIFATNLGDKKNFYWLDSGKPLFYSKFAPNEPNNIEHENCLEIWKTSSGVFEWNDAPCDTKLRFICKYREL
ncbi:salivary C-type lectin 2-like [Rhynchophorus ferrugineus]|uniref:salivary C-type lectin 2-like n=1 Tax=Rhynchophorus ferrugineus TaxID=354439 RepID=UPI003FCD7A93